MLLALSQLIAFDKRRSRSKSTIPTLSRAAILIELDATILGSSIVPSGTAELGKKAEQYLKDTKLPNIYVAVYYLATANKYGLTVNCNSLLNKDKHCGFKK